ncbi:hypothetical protein BJ878DRAFT_400366, partial [Calycina marina]
MATSTPSQAPTSNIPIETQRNLLTGISIGALIVGPIIIALPPRKLDFYTIALVGGTFAGGNQVCHEYTGRSIIWRVKDRAKKMSGGELPEKARLVQKRLKEEKARHFEESLSGAKYVVMAQKEEGGGIPQERGSKVLEEVEKKRAETDQDREKQRLVDKIWFGGEGKDWKQKRDQREKEYLEDGRGYGDLIMDQIWEVWNWGKDNKEEHEEV